MNNNRGNNRRRGRGNRQGGGGQQLNRIDSRARGNAPQLLEKYRKLAQDAHMNGDRVQAEYYLQFADHYFRVIADQRLRQEELRRPRDERWQDSAEAERDEADDAGEFSGDSDFPSFDQPVYTRREREERLRPARSGQDEPAERDQDEEPRGAADDAAEETARNPYEPPENPFVRTDRPNRAALRAGRGEGDAEGRAARAGLLEDQRPAVAADEVGGDRAEVGEDLARDRLALGGRLLGEGEREVAGDEPAARTSAPVVRRPRPAADWHRHKADRDRPARVFRRAGG